MKKSSFFIFLVVICASMAMLTSCEYDIVRPEPAPIVIIIPPGQVDTISFVQDIIPIFNASCNSCHAAGAIPPDLSPAGAFGALNAGGYLVAGKPADSKLYNDMKPGGVMASYSTPAQLSLISRWITAGAKNN